MFTSCEVAFYKLNIQDASFTNYHHMFESNFKRLYLRWLCEKTILIKCNSTLDESNTTLAERYRNCYKDIESVELFHLKRFTYKNSLAI